MLEVTLVTKPNFLIGTGNESLVKANSPNLKPGFIDENENNVALESEGPGDDADQFSDPTEGPPRLSLNNNKTMFVDVIVNNSVSPVNFSVQNYRQSNNLKELELGMTSSYKNSKSTLLFKDLRLHGYYAVKYCSSNSANNDKTSGRWVRCQIMKPFNENMPVLTHLIDHGFYYTTEPQCIQPLKRSFLQMPIQSFEAKLHFVDSTKFQFTPEDCHRFHKNVEGKHFCGIIVQNDSGKKPPESKINIILIDTSAEKDVYVHQDFVPKKLR